MHMTQNIGPVVLSKRNIAALGRVMANFDASEQAMASPNHALDLLLAELERGLTSPNTHVGPTLSVVAHQLTSSQAA